MTLHLIRDLARVNPPPLPAPRAAGIIAILETLRMLQIENLDIRTTTLGVNPLDCAGVVEIASSG